MSEEIKEEKSKAGVVTAVVIAIAVIAGGIMFFKPSNNGKVQEQKVATATTAPKPKAEKTVARIDIITKLVDAKKPQFEVYVDGSKTPEKQADWMPKFGNQGYVVQRHDGAKNIKLKALKDVDIDIILRGPDKRDENKKFIPVWVKYTSVTVNGKKILSEPVSVWHNKPFRHTIKTKSGDEIKIHAEWTKSDKQ